jgi:5'-nucleotidase
MPFSVDDKLVIGVASIALFDIQDSDRVWREQGCEAYEAYQRQHENDIFQPGVAFPFLKRLLSLNSERWQPVEVILLSKNSADTVLRVFKSIDSHGLGITRGAFLSGAPPWHYIPAFKCSLFLSANENDVREAIMSGYPAGTVLDSKFTDEPSDRELRIAFDFDGVLADDESEKVYQETGLTGYHSSEKEKASQALSPGPFKELLEKIATLQSLEKKLSASNPQYKPIIKTAIITARNAPAHERLIQTLRAWGIKVDHVFMLGGMEKIAILSTFKPHIFFDDQKVHLDTACGIVPSVHVPFGIMNRSVPLADCSAGI